MAGKGGRGQEQGGGQSWGTPLPQGAGQGGPCWGQILNDWESKDMKAAIAKFNMQLQVRFNCCFSITCFSFFLAILSASLIFSWLFGLVKR